MTAAKKSLPGRPYRYLCLLALLLCACSQLPEYCGDNNKFNSATQFCHYGQTINRCGDANGNGEYDPVGYTCDAGVNIVERCENGFYVVSEEPCGAGVAMTPRIDVPPVGGMVAKGVTYTLSVAASAADGSRLRYQWFGNRIASNQGGGRIDGATDTVYNVYSERDTVMYIYVTVTNPNGNSDVTVRSDYVTITVGTVIDAEFPSIDTEPRNVTMRLGDESRALTVGASVSDGGNLTYQWYVSTTEGSSDWRKIEGATGESYDIHAEEIGTLYYRVEVINTNTDVNGVKIRDKSSRTVTVRINDNDGGVDAEFPDVSGPGNAEVDVGGSEVVLSITVPQPSDGGDLTYQWFSNTVESEFDGTAIEGANGLSYTVPTTAAGTAYYYVEVTNTVEVAGERKTAMSTSRVATVKVNPKVHADPPSIFEHPISRPVMINTACTISVAASFPPSGGHLLKYQWYSNEAANNSGGTPIPGAHEASYIVPATSENSTRHFYVIVTNWNGAVNGDMEATAASDVATITVNALVNAQMPRISASPAGRTMAVGTAHTISVGANVTDDGTLSYQWYRSEAASSAGSVLISGAVNHQYTIPADHPPGVYNYHAVVTNTIFDNGDGGSKVESMASQSAEIKIGYTLTLARNPANGGTVNNLVSSQILVPGESYNIVAIASNGYRFVDWTASSSAAANIVNRSNPSTQVTITGHVTVTANFAPNMQIYTLAFSRNPLAGGNTNPAINQSVAEGTPFPISATASAGYSFINWTANNTNARFEDATRASTTVTLSGNANVTANFRQTGRINADTLNVLGVRYPTVMIGGSQWMAKNMNITTQSGSYCYEDVSDCDAIGRLYTYDAAVNVCNTLEGRWRLPSQADWDAMLAAIGHSKTGENSGAAQVLKSRSGWPQAGTDVYGFSAIPGGVYDVRDSLYEKLGTSGFWWTSTALQGSNTYVYRWMIEDNTMQEFYSLKDHRYSVRCVQ